jgi:hypothetical protein
MPARPASPTSPVDTGAEINERHTRKCSICRHPDRDAIEEEFTHWHRVIWIAQEFHIADHRSIYRHARAVGLIKARRENLHSALDNIVEQSDGIRASASDVLKAMRAYSCLDAATGRWVDPPKQVALNYTIQPTQNLSSRQVSRSCGAPEGPAASPKGATRGTDTPVCAPGAEPGVPAIGGPITSRNGEPADSPETSPGLSTSYDDDPTDPSSPNYIEQGPDPADVSAREEWMRTRTTNLATASLIGPPVIRIQRNSLKTKGGPAA